jgi:uncharacterized membrane protein
MERLLYIVTFAAALGSGLVADIFFAFSTFVMGALARIQLVVRAIETANLELSECRLRFISIRCRPSVTKR